MRACPVCGSPNGDTDEFCGNCGNYLGWSDTAPETPATTQEAPAQPAEPANAAEAVGPVGPVRPGAVPPPPTAPSVPAAPDQPGPRQPARPVAPRPTATAPAAGVAVDGPPCPRCGTPNSPERKFCRHCAAPLNPTAVAAATAHKRRWGIGGRWGLTARRLFALLVVALLVVLAVVFLPQERALYEDVRDKLGHAVPVVANRITATAEVPGHPASAAADGFSNKYWGAPAVGDSVTFGFAAPFRLLSVVITPGASPDPGPFAAQGRPTSVDLVVTDSGGRSTTLAVPITDRPGPQTVNTGISDVVGIRLVIRSAAGLAPGRDIAVGEVEFFKRA